MLKQTLQKIFRTSKRQQSVQGSSPDMLALQATYNYGVSLFHMGQDWAYEYAAEAFQKILKRTPIKSTPAGTEIIDLTHGVLACTYAKLAERQSRQRDRYCTLAKEQTTTLLQRPASDAAKALAYAADGLVHFALDQYQQAIEYFERSLQMDKNITALLGLGDVHRKMGNVSKAIEYYRNASVMTSGGYSAYRLGNLYREAGDKERAIEAYKQAPALSTARLSLGKLYLEGGELDAALDEFRSAVRLNQKNSEAWVNVAWVILEQESTNDDLIKECVDAARRAVQLDKGHTQEWHRRAILAMSLIAAQKPEQALKEAQIGQSLAPHRAQVQYCVALCEFHLSRHENATEILQEILRSDEHGLWRTKTERLIKEISRKG